MKTLSKILFVTSVIFPSIFLYYGEYFSASSHLVNRILMYMQCFVGIGLCFLFAFSFNTIKSNLSDGRHKQKIDVFFIQLIGIAMLFIGFTFGIHADKFSGQDKSLSTRCDYNWFMLRDIYKFPFDQYLLKDKPFENPPINIDKDIEPIAHFIILDKTTSTKQSPLTKTLYDSTKKELSSLIVNNCLTLNNQTGVSQLGDILSISSIRRGFATDSSKYYFNASLYNGNNEFLPLNYFFTRLDNNNFCDQVSKFISNSQNSVPPVTHVSNYATILNEIKMNYLSEPQLLKVKNCKIIVSIIGDFFHETDFEPLEKSIKELYELNIIHHLNLIVLPTYVSNPQKAITYSKRVEYTLGLFNSNYRDKIEISELESKHLTEKSSQGKVYEMLNAFSTHTYHSGKDQEVTLYLPYIEYKPNAVAKAKIFFTGFEKDILISMNATDFDDKQFGLNLGNKKLFLNNFTRIKLEDWNKGIEISFSGIHKVESEINSIYLLANEDGSPKKIRIPVVFKNRLTPTACLILIFFYTILYTASFFITLSLLLNSFSENSYNIVEVAKGLMLLLSTILYFNAIVYGFTLINFTMENINHSKVFSVLLWLIPIIILLIMYLKYDLWGNKILRVFIKN